MHLLKDVAAYPEWAATVAFYKAVHVVEAVYANQHNFHSTSHDVRQRKLKTDPRLKTYFTDYQMLMTASRVARYLQADRNSPAFSTSEATSVDAIQKDISQSHEQIMEQIAMLQEQVKRNRAPFCIFVSTLAVNDISVLKPIPVTVEPEEDGSFVASFIDAGVSSGGKTLHDAVWSLQQMIASSFNTLFGMGDSKLGPKMLRKRNVLMEFLCRSPKTTP